MERSKTGFIVGLEAEARMLRDSDFIAGIGGGFPEGAARACENLITKEVEALISFGLAGGLAPDLLPGTILIPAAVMESKQIFRCDPKIVQWLGGATVDYMVAGADIAVTAAQKAALFERTKAAAIDLESGAVARVAAKHGIPFAVLRAIADPAVRTLPPAALIALNAAGKIRMRPILASVIKNPGQIPALLALAKDAAQARAALVKRLKELV